MDIEEDVGKLLGSKFNLSVAGLGQNLNSKSWETFLTELLSGKRQVTLLILFQSSLSKAERAKLPSALFPIRTTIKSFALEI